VTLFRYVLRELLLHFLFASALVAGVSVIGTLFQIARTFDGLGMDIIVRFVPLAMGYLAPYALLLAAATAATLVYARLSADHEIDAMRMGGISPGRILLPAVVFGLLLAVGSWLIAEYATPNARHNRRMEIRKSVLEVLREPPSGPQSFTIGSYRLSYLDFRDGVMDRPALLQLDHATAKPVFEFYAPQGRIRVEEGANPVVTLSRPRYAQFDADGSEHRFRAESDLSVPMKIEGLTKANRRPEDLSRAELVARIGASADRRERNTYLTVLHGRYAQALAPLFLVLCCVPLGMAVRRSSRLAGLGTALPPLLVHFAASFFFQGMGQRGRLEGVPAAWASDAILALLAALLLGAVGRRR
jgi:lipopolysaccharide export system permease protein